MNNKLRRLLHIRRRSKLDKAASLTRKVVGDLGRKQVGVLSAGIAFYAILAFFPFVIAVVAFGSLFIDPTNFEGATDILTTILPGDLANLLTVQLNNALGQSTDNILVAIIAVIVSIISVSGVVGSLMGALNSIYDQPEKRSFIAQRLVGAVLALGVIVAMLILIPLLLVGRDLLTVIGLPESVQQLFGFARWILLSIAMIVGLNIIYRIGPSVKHHGKWPGLNRAILVSTGLWVIVSILFFFYATNMSNLTRSYSLFAGVIGMMIWFNLTAYIVLLGAVIDHRDHKR